MVLPDFSSPEIWVSLLTLTFLEIVLGIDNIIFISISTARLPEKQRKFVTQVGLLMAMVQRIILLFAISWLISMNRPLFEMDWGWLNGVFSGQSLILIAGGIFLLYKSTSEIHHKLEGDTYKKETRIRKSRRSLANALIQILLIDLVFSVDSILTAVGMTSGLTGALFIMIIAVVLSILIMMFFAYPVGRFVNNHPTVQMLALSFLILIGFMLVVEGAHLAHLSLAGSEIGSIPKGYLYFAIAFSLGVEALNMRLRKKQDPVQLHGYQEEAVKDGILAE
jgi:predicted tellurium resistance membrane protein TerC